MCSAELNISEKGVIVLTDCLDRLLSAVCCLLLRPSARRSSSSTSTTTACAPLPSAYSPSLDFVLTRKILLSRNPLFLRNPTPQRLAVLVASPCVLNDPLSIPTRLHDALNDNRLPLSSIFPGRNVLHLQHSSRLPFWCVYLLVQQLPP